MLGGQSELDTDHQAAEDRLLWHQIVTNVVHPYSFTTPDHMPYRLQQFLGAISHSLGAHTAAFDVAFDASDADDDHQQHQQLTQQDESTMYRVVNDSAQREAV